jgi:hypothetical protein
LARHVERASVLLDYRSRVPFAALELALFAVEAGNVLWWGGCGFGWGKVFSIDVERTRADGEIFGVGGRAAARAKIVAILKLRQKI